MKHSLLVLLRAGVCACCAAGLLECTIEAFNQGNVRLNSFSLGGDAVSCGRATAQTIPPGGSVRCLLRKNVTAQQLAGAGQLQLAYPVTVAPAGQAPALQGTPLNMSSLSLAKLIAASPACSTCRNCMQGAN